MLIKDIPTGFPRNLTFRITPEEIKSVARQSGPDDNIKIILSCTQEQKTSFSAEAVGKKIGRHVTMVYDMPEENHSRSPEIAKMQSPKEKLAEYMRINGMEDDESLYPLLKELDESLAIEYTFPCHMFRLVKLELRGAIGFKEGIGRDNFEVDFTSFVPGIVALCGSCGRGKTTLIENCHPYLRMLTRSGKLQSHFFLKDSYRKLTFQDEEGTYYLVDIQIDGKNKSGKVHAFAYTGKSLDNLKPVPGLNGNVDPYEKWCAETFGSIDIFLKTAFFTKGNTGSVPDLSSATKGEKRTLFNSLLGFEKLSGISAAAREKRKQYEQETKDAKLAVEDRDFDEETRTVEKELDATVSRLEAIKKEISDNEKKLASMEADGKTIDYRSRIAEAETELEKLRMLHNHYAEAAEVMAEWEDKKDFYEAYLVAKNRYEELVSAMTGAREELSSKEKSLDKIEKEIRESEFRTKSIQTVIDERTKNLPDEIDESCPTCGQRLPPSKIEELRADLEKRRAEIEERKNELAAAMEETASLETSKGMYAETEVIPARERLSRLEDEQAELAEKLHDSESLEKLKMKAESYGDYKEADLQNVQKKIDEYETRLESDRKKLSEESDDTDTADSLKKKTESLRDEMTSLSMKQGELTNEITNIKKAQKRSEDAKKLAGELARMASSYEMLEKAFGPDGIQALELEAAAPEIADITNGILHRAYGDKFRIQFQTLRVGASNNLIEDFNITITNVETGTSKPLEWLSGGEGTWIKEALFHAFSIIRAKKQKSGFLTRFLDEADGSLDPDSRLKFLQLIKAVHEEENSELTVLITHSTELKDLIEQKIEL